MNYINLKIFDTFSKNNIKFRPYSSAAFEVSFLLPLSILIALFKSPEILTLNYKLSTIVAAGLILSNIVLIAQCVYRKNLKFGLFHYLSLIFISFLFHICLHKDYIFSLISGLFSTVLYYKGLPLLLNTFPQSFSFGEAALVTQGGIFFSYQALVNILNAILHTPNKNVQISTIIIQIGVIGLATILYVAYRKKYFRNTVPFYGLTFFVLSFIIILPLHILLKRSPVLWVIQFLTKSSRTISVILFWILCTFVAVITVNNQIKKGRKAGTATRKVFHILAFVTYLVGLIDQCSVLYLASGVIFVLFVALETLRILNIPPLGSYLQDGFVIMQDEKDAGNVALTPIYLLVGCSIPIWIHPDTCDVTDSAGFNLLPLMGGILTVGIGDTCASVFGSWLGKHKWPRSKKSLEGTLACIFSQLIFVFLLFHSGFIYYNKRNITKAVTAVIITSIFEAKTDQIDNILLPLVSYLILY